MTAFQNYLEQIRREPILSAEQERELVERLRAGDERARHALLKAHLKLCVKIAKGFRGYGHDLSDLLGVAAVGAMKAIDRYDPDRTGADGRQARLATVISYWARAELSEWCMREASPVRIGTTSAQKSLFHNLKRQMSRVGALDSNLTQQQAASIADALNVRVEEVFEMHARMRNAISLDQPIRRDDSESETVGEQIADDAASIEDVLGDQQEHELAMVQIAAAMSQLSEREREIIAMRLADDGATLQDISDRFGISRERSRQVYERALAKTRAVVKGEPLPKLPPRKKKGASEAAPVGRNHRQCPSCKTIKAWNAFDRNATRCKLCTRHVAKMRALTAKLAA